MKAIKLCLFIALACCIMAAISGCQPNPSPIIKPEDNRFTTEVLASNLDEPMQFEMLADGRVLFAERKGKLKVYDPIVRKVTIIADIPVRHSFAGYTSSGTHESEDGILGVLLDPQFNSNHWIYLFYAPENRGPKDVLSRFEWNGSTVNLASEKVLLEVPLDTSVCCHLGGGMVFDNNGNLLVATGENGQADDGYSTLDERPGHETSDAQRTSANSNSFNGKILRIHPERDGTYTIPPGNLFPPGTDKTRPEIYTMGNRNPWRLNIDFKTGWLYWGEVGPNGDEDSEERGPRAYDEFNQAKAAGNFGYPHFIADNKAYRRYDFSSGKAGNTFDPLRPTNLSRNNTGINELPPAKPAFIWYPYRASDSFPLLGTGAMSAVGGPIYRHAKFPNAEHPFPKYFEGKWFITDWVRGWIMAVSMDDNGSYKSMEPFLPAQKHYGIIDMDFGPDGSLYLLEYGTGVFRASPEARLVRISYNAGNRAPVAKVRLANKAGQVPLKIRLDGNESVDPDGDSLLYQWQIKKDNKLLFKSGLKNLRLVIHRPGMYTGELTVMDKAGAIGRSEFQLIAGNEPPVIHIDLNGANESFFYPGEIFKYKVDVSDKEDGLTNAGNIATNKVAFEIERVEILNRSVLESLPWKQQEATSTMMANLLIDNSDCRSCHSLKDPSIGPSFQQVSAKYSTDKSAIGRLAKKIISGGNGSWGDRMMPAHPGLTGNEARTLAKYILSIGSNAKPVLKPLKGQYKIEQTSDTNKQEFHILRATYSDLGAANTASLDADERIVLRNPFVPVSRVDGYHNIEFNRQVDLDNSDITTTAHGSWLSLNQVDLSGIRAITFNASCSSDSLVDSGWEIEVRIDSIQGPLVGKTPTVLSSKSSSVSSGERLTALIQPTMGKRDLYFYFTHNSRLPLSQLKVRDIKFELK